MACLASDFEALRTRVAESLSAVGLQLVDIDNERTVESLEDVAEIDEHLAMNIEKLEPSKFAVWGILHTYLAAGEA